MGKFVSKVSLKILQISLEESGYGTRINFMLMVCIVIKCTRRHMGGLILSSRRRVMHGRLYQGKRLTEENVAYESVTRYLVPQGAILVIVYFPSINQRVYD